MKTAIIHYWLVNDRGGEKVLAKLAELFPDADVFTHVYHPDVMPDPIRRLKVYTTFIQKLPFARRFYHIYLPLMPWALQRIDLSGYDLIISCESGPAKGICKPEGAVHICYCLTPMRYLWDMSEDYFRRASLLGKAGMKLLLPALRKWDLWSATQVDHFVADSRFVAERIRRTYNRESTVIYPPVDVARFARRKRRPQDFYLFAGQLTAYKRADLAVEAFSRTGRRLIVAGTGDEAARLQACAAKNVEFAGRVPDDQMEELYSTCRALIFPGIEDFGMVPVEALAAGAPVIAFRAGGALETVTENETGIFFAEPSAEALIRAVERFEMRNFDESVCRHHARRFSDGRFKAEFTEFCGKVIPAGRMSDPACTRTAIPEAD